MQHSKLLWAAWLRSTWAVFVATLVVYAWPHARGIGFHPWLRHAVLVPVCLLACVVATYVHAARTGRMPGRRGRVATVALAVFGLLQAVGVVAGLASERPKVVAADLPRALFDVEHRFVTLPSGARVHYVDEGKGDTLLFLHGNPSWSFQWRTLIDGLRATHRCVALDYPGFGWSDGPPGFGFTPLEESRVVEEFVAQLGLRDVTLVMQDWGGPIGLGFGVRHPELVRGVVLGSTWAWPTTTSDPRGKFSAIMGGPLGEFLQVSFNAFASAGLQNGVVRTLRPDELDAYLRPFRSLEGRGIAAFYPGQINDATEYFREVEAGLPRLADKPAVIFWAGRDRGFPASDREKWEAAFPHHETIELPDADHFFFEDAAETMIMKMR